jgi:hypothetical protein
MNIAYSDFALSDLEEKFGVTNERKELNFQSSPIEPTQWLKKNCWTAKKCLSKAKRQEVSG